MNYNLNKTEIINLRLTYSQRQYIENASYFSNMTPSEYMRQRIFKDDFIILSYDLELMNKIYSNIAMIGNNINQIARLLNSHKSANMLSVNERNNLEELIVLVSDGMKIIDKYNKQIRLTNKKIHHLPSGDELIDYGFAKANQEQNLSASDEWLIEEDVEDYDISLIYDNRTLSFSEEEEEF